MADEETINPADPEAPPAEAQEPGPSGLDNVEAVFPGVVDDWFHMLNQGYRHTGVATSDSHATVGEEPFPGHLGLRNFYEGITVPPLGRRIWPVMKQLASEAK